MAIAVKDLLTTLLAEQNTWQVYIMQNWQTIIGDLHQHMCLEKIVDGTLQIGVFHPHWMQELHLLSNTIIRTLNRALQKEFTSSELYVKKLHFRYKDKKQRRAEKSAMPEHGTGSRERRLLTSNEKKALERISDPELQLIISTLLSLPELK